MRIVNIALGFSLLLCSLALPVKSQQVSQQGSQIIIRDENQRIAREIRRGDSRTRTNRFYRYCRRPRLTIRAKQLKVERIYRYSIYCGKKVLHGWTFFQRENRQGKRLRAYLYDREGYLLEERELSLRRYDRSKRGRQISLFVSPKVGSVTIQRINSNRRHHRYDRRNRGDYDDDDD